MYYSFVMDKKHLGGIIYFTVESKLELKYRKWKKEQRKGGGFGVVHG